MKARKIEGKKFVLDDIVRKFSTVPGRLHMGDLTLFALLEKMFVCPLIKRNPIGETSAQVLNCLLYTS